MKNTLHSIEITGCTHDGMGVARIDGRAVFVSNAAVGDKGIARIVKATGKVLYAIWESLETPSDKRVPPDCPLFPACGGCDFRHITYAEELRVKALRVQETLRRIAGVDKPPDKVLGAPATGSPELTCWRNKAVLPVALVKGHYVTGFYRARSHDIVPCTRCIQLPENADSTAKALREWLDETKEDVLCLLWRMGAEVDGVCEELCCVVTRKKRLRDEAGLVEVLCSANSSLSSIWHDYNPISPGGSENRVLGGNGRLLWGKPSIKTCTGRIVHTLNPYTFGQVNHAQMYNMLGVLREFADLKGNENILDLYCGTGVLGLNLAAEAKTVTGAEIVADSVEAANEAAKHNGIGNYTAVCGDVSRLAVQFPSGAADLVVVDPPRKGLETQALESLVRLNAPRIIYVSCDPATLARDLAVLLGNGYTLKRNAVIDMFPRTANVETVCLLEK